MGLRQDAIFINGVYRDVIEENPAGTRTVA